MYERRNSMKLKSLIKEIYEENNEENKIESFEHVCPNCQTEQDFGLYFESGGTSKQGLDNFMESAYAGDCPNCGYSPFNYHPSLYPRANKAEVAKMDNEVGEALENYFYENVYGQ